MVQISPRVAIIPLLNEKRLYRLFLRLAMEMAMVIQRGDEGRDDRIKGHEKINNTQRIA